MTTTPNPAEVAARVLELSEQATPGPWVARDRHRPADVCSPEGTTKSFDDGTCMPVCSAWGDDGKHITDAELIAYYRTAAPLLARALLEAEQREMALVVARRAWPIGALVTIPMLDAIDAIVAAHDARTGDTP